MLLETFAGLVLEFLENNQYLAMFAVLVLCGVGLPLPEEIPLLASGVVVGFGLANFWLASLACVSAILAGDSIIFFAGRYLGRRFPESWFIRSINAPKVRGFFTRHGRKAVFFARFFAGVRIGVYAYAGQHGMRWLRFIFLDLLGALISGPTSIWLGKYAAEQLGETPAEAFARARGLFEEYRPWFLAAIGVLVLATVLVVVWRARRRRARERDLAALPRTDEPPRRGRPAGTTLSGRSDGSESRA